MTRDLMNRSRGLATALVCALFLSGCATSRSLRLGDAASRSGDLDQAVAHYREAVQASPNNPKAKIALERALLAASRAHFDRGREFESHEQLEAARSEYQLAGEYDPANKQAAAKVSALDQKIRDQAEAARPRPAIEQMRDRVRAAAQAPILNPASREPLKVRYVNANIKDILSSIGNAAGISVNYDREVTERSTTIQLDEVTFEDALNQILAVNQLAYKILGERSILVFPDTAPKHAQYDEQVVQTFYLSNADATELTQLLSSIIRLPGIAVQPAIQFNKSANSVIVRGTRPVVQIIERIISQNDKPRAEVVFDIEILEVDRSRVKQYGLNLSQYALGGMLSPEVAPTGAATSGTSGTTGTTTAASGSPTGLASPPPFNLNTISRGLTSSDFYAAVPTAFVRFLESDTRTRVIAKPQLRGAEGSKLTLNLGDEIPIVSTSYTPIATGGAAVNPLNSFQLKPVGINIDITPRVTLEGDVLIELSVESSSRGADVNVAGTNYPSFGSRKVGTKLRLRDGESNLLAGLLREDERRSLNGFPGAIHVPVLKQLFSNNDQIVAQTDIVMLLTPRIIRTQGITEEDLKPVFIGSQQNLALGGAPPLIAAPAETLPPVRSPSSTPPSPGAALPRSPAAAPGARAIPENAVPAGTTMIAPPGSSAVPGTVMVPPPQQVAAVTPAVDSRGDRFDAVPAGAPPVPPEPVAPPAPAPPPPAAAAPSTQPSSLGPAQIILSPPGATMRVGGGPYLVPISVVNVSRLSTVSFTLAFDPALLHIRAVNEGSFMRAGGAEAVFTQQVSPGRVDVTITRPSDETGASGSGLLGAFLFDAIGPGAATLNLSGFGAGPGGMPMGIQFRPSTVTVQ